MVDLFLAAGFTYFDTAYGYLGGKSEEAVKTAIVDRYPREKLHAGHQAPRLGGRQDGRGGEGDVLHLPAADRGRHSEIARSTCSTTSAATGPKFSTTSASGTLSMSRRKRGLIKHLGFSMHDSAEALDKVLTEHPEVEFVQLQINYADWDSDSVQSRLCYETARKHGKPVVIMEPVKGGSLANLPESAAHFFKEAEPDMSVASWALRFAASLDGLITVLSGMSTVEQMEDNLKVMKDFHKLTPGQLAVIDKAKEALAAIPTIPCTNCQYCMKGCPQGVKIPAIFSAVNAYKTYNHLAGAKGSYNFATRDGGKASECIACGQCESVCPQHIEIIDELKKAAELFE